MELLITRALLLGFWIKLCAFVIDSLILFLVLSVVAVATSESNVIGVWLLQRFLEALFFTVLFGLVATSIGKRLFRLYVIRNNGLRVGFARAGARYLLYYVSAITLLIAFIMIGFRCDKRGLPDLICDTKVIKCLVEYLVSHKCFILYLPHGLKFSGV